MRRRDWVRCAAAAAWLVGGGSAARATDDLAPDNPPPAVATANEDADRQGDGGPVAPAPRERLAANPAELKDPAGQEARPLLTLDGGADLTTGYFFRGYRVEQSGLIVQPYATLKLNAVQTDPLNASVYVGTWGSFHSESRGADDWRHWNEIDLFGGVELSRGNWSLNLSYLRYMYPSGTSRETEEVGAILSYDDTELFARLFPGLPAVALHPHVSVFHETHDRNGGEDTYLELGVEPQYEVPNTPVTLAVPVLVGTSLDGYYTDAAGRNEFLGYGSVGLKASYQLDDHWSLNAAVTYLRLNAASAVGSNGGQRDAVTGTVGVGFSL